MVILFFIALFIIVYTYIIYPLLLFFFSKKTIVHHKETQLVTFSIIIPAYNEATILHKKIANTKQLIGNYKVQIILHTGGSTDGSQTLVFDNVVHITDNERKGKAAAMNEAVALATGNIWLFTDANTMLSTNALIEINKQMQNETIGMVTGKKIVEQLNAEHNYWSFENRLKELESNYHTVIGAPGELLAIRAALYTTIPTSTILDDFFLSLQVLATHHRIAFIPLITATEAQCLHLQQEYNRKVRIAAGALQWMHHHFIHTFIRLTNKAKWQFFSNKICRWFLAPIALFIVVIVGLLATNTWLFYTTIGLFFLLVISSLVYVSKIGFSILSFPFYMFFIHICLVVGYVQYTLGKATVLWQKPNR